VVDVEVVKRFKQSRHCALSIVESTSPHLALLEGCKIESRDNSEVVATSSECIVEIREGFLVDLIDGPIREDNLERIILEYVKKSKTLWTGSPHSC
jgi:hypothetical protein